MLRYMRDRRGFNLVFEDKARMMNLISCSITVHNDRPVHDRGSLVHSLLRLEDTLVYDIKQKPNRYIFPIGLYHNPSQWAGHRYNPIYDKSLFENIPQAVLDDARNGNALILLDQVQEAYQVRWLYDWFHDNIRTHNLPAKCIAFCTGDMTAKDSYDLYCKDNLIRDGINVLSDMVIQCYDFCIGTRYGYVDPITWDEQLSHKTENRYSIKLHNCLNRRLAMHRQWLYVRLSEEGLVDDSLVSMDQFDRLPFMDKFVGMPDDIVSKHLDRLPLTVDIGFKENRHLGFNKDIYLNTWLTIVTETTATDNEDSVMITEKLMKPMMASHPFIVWGNRKTLRYLRDLGFKTFSDTIDEGYDTKYDFYRLDHIVNEVLKINSISDKLEWFKRCEDAIRHNHELVSSMSWDSGRQCATLKSIWRDLLDMNDGRKSA